MPCGQQNEMPQRQVIHFEGEKQMCHHKKGSQMASTVLGGLRVKLAHK